MKVTNREIRKYRETNWRIVGFGLFRGFVGNNKNTESHHYPLTLLVSLAAGWSWIHEITHDRMSWESTSPGFKLCARGRTTAIPTNRHPRRNYWLLVPKEVSVDAAIASVGYQNRGAKNSSRSCFASPSSCDSLIWLVEGGVWQTVFFSQAHALFQTVSMDDFLRRCDKPSGASGWARGWTSRNLFKVTITCAFIAASYPECSREVKAEGLTARALINNRPSVTWSEEHCDQAWGENKS